MASERGASAGTGAPGLASLPRRERLLFASSSLGSEALLQSRAAWLLYLYAPPPDSGLPQLLSLGLMGVLLALMRVLGSFDDAIVGWWSDRTTSRWGRRAPFIVLGAPAWALTAALLMNPPEESGTGRIVLWFVLTIQGSNLFAALAGAPYDALIPEIARRDADRLALASARVYFGILGAALGLVASGVLADRFGIGGMAVAMSVLALVTRYIGLFGVWKRLDRDGVPAKVGLLEGLKTTFRNGHFRAFLPAFVCFSAAIGMVIGALPYYAGAILQAADTGRWVSWLSAAAVAGISLGVPVYGWLARRTSKRQAYRTAMLATVATLPLLALVGAAPGLPVPVPAQALAAMFIGSFALAGAYVFPAALLADIVDEEAHRLGMRREGSYYGAQGFVDKTTSAVAPVALSGLMMLGNTAAHPLGVRLIGPAAAAVVLAGLWLFRGYALGEPAEGEG
ncbi:MAG: MFS transporter [Chloroflexota bacterium]